MSMKVSLTVFSVLICSLVCFGRKIEKSDMQYRRNSIYNIVVVHKNQQFADDIFQQFTHVPVPDKYNDHNLSVSGIYVDGNVTRRDDIDNFITKNHIASRMVGKWFNRNINTGECSVDLIKARGMYNATEFDKAFASRHLRGNALLEDAGESLIGNTYLLVNDVTYIDQNKGARIAAGILMVVGALVGVAVDAYSSSRNNGNSGNSGLTLGLATGAAVGAMVETIKGFRVRITTSLYKLVWDEETAATFYTKHYTDVPDETKRSQFERDRSMYKLRYVGQVVSRGSSTSFLGINEDHPEMMIRKACQRAIDENVVDLQRKFEFFKVKSPILTAGSKIQVPIGKKEGVSPNSVYEVLQARQDGEKIVYDRVATIQPDKGKIWDNRFMAKEENAEGADLGSTTFHKLSGGKIMVGMLVREIKNN